MKKILILAIIVTVSGLIAYLFVFHKPHKNTFKLKAEYIISASELLTEFETDENNANSKYLGKIIQVEGEIIKIKNISGNYEISFIDELFGVTCIVDSVYAVQQRDELIQLKVGNNIKIKGQCNGYLSDVKLDRCIISD
ncbi:MAG: OB-fold putative lipoprotein [Bacteroidales bacterium]|nr:OB-fold putative lipoprotein [Bacteroidales bacterium]